MLKRARLEPPDRGRVNIIASRNIRLRLARRMLSTSGSYEPQHPAWAPLFEAGAVLTREGPMMGRQALSSFRIFCPPEQCPGATGACTWYGTFRGGLRGWLVPIRLLLRDEVFSPEDITVITWAFEDTLQAMGVHDRTHPTATLIAKRIIDLARPGERNPGLLRDAVLKSLRDDPGVSAL